MTTSMPRDADDNAIPVLGFRDGGAHTISVSAASGRNATAFNTETRVVSIYATVNVFIKQGNSSVVATTSDHFIPAGIWIDIDIGGGKTAHRTHIAVIRSASDGALYISERE